MNKRITVHSGRTQTALGGIASSIRKKRTREKYPVGLVDAVMNEIRRGNSSVGGIAKAVDINRVKACDVCKHLVTKGEVRRSKRNCYKPKIERVKPMVFWFTPYLDAPMRVKR